MSDQDPIRWAEAPDRAPPGAAELVRSIEAPPPLPPDLSRLVIARARPPAYRRWIGPSLAAAVILGGVVLWRFSPAERQEPVAIAALDEPAAIDAAAIEPTAIEPTAIEPTAIEPWIATEDLATASDDLETADIEAGDTTELGTTASPPARERPRPRWHERHGDPRPGVSIAQRVGDERADRAFGYLMVQSIPWARVFVDGRDTGRNTPIRNLRLPVGRHTIGLRTNDGIMHTVMVTIEPDTTTRIVRQL